MRHLASVISVLAQLIQSKLGGGSEGDFRLSESASKRMRRQQIRGAIEQMRVFLVGNTFFAPVLAFQAWNIGINATVFFWTVAILGFSWWLFFQWRSSYETDGCQSDMDKFVRETKLNAGLWCMGFALFFPYVDGDGKTILTTVMAGSLALGTFGFSQAPAAAIWYLGIQTVTLTVVPLTHGVINGSNSDILIGVLALFASGAIFNAVLERSNAQRIAFIDHEDLARKSEVIDLLLKDYEEQGIEWFWQTDNQGKLITGPKQVLDLIGIDSNAGKSSNLIAKIKQHVDPRGALDLKRAERAFAGQIDFHDVTLPFFDQSYGRSRWIMMRGRPQFENGIFSGFRGIFADATTTVEAKRQIEHLADHDSLTGTYNRNAVQQRLKKLNKNQDSAIVFLIDLDGFKQVNDSYGHAVGDELLKIMGQRLRAQSHEGDLVARLGGDEFIILIDRNARPTPFDPDAFANLLLSTLSDPYLVKQYDIALSASIGTAQFPEDTTMGSNLLIQADLALYVAKQGGRDRCCAFVERMQVGLQKRLVVTERLKKAVNADEIKAFYQPQYCTRTLQLVGFETLARWNDAELGTVGPDIFIPIAEETGLIHQLGEQMLRHACRDAAAWPKSVHGEDLLVSVNLSPVQVTRGNIAETVAAVLEETGLPPDRLEIEITEGVLIHDMDATRNALENLSKIGIKIALDDFGTGYSSLSYLRALPLDRLKIDRAFVADLSNYEARSIVQTIITLCKTLGLQVIAEGVETEECIHNLAEMECDVLQGYYFAPPIPISETTALIEGRVVTSGGRRFPRHRHAG